MTTDTIYETDLADLQFPHDVIEEMDVVDEAVTCCGSIPCMNPEGCPR